MTNKTTRDKQIELLRARIKNLELSNDSLQMRLSDANESEMEAFDDITKLKDYLQPVRVCGEPLSLERLETILGMQHDAGVVH